MEQTKKTNKKKRKLKTRKERKKLKEIRREPMINLYMTLIAKMAGFYFSIYAC